MAENSGKVIVPLLMTMLFGLFLSISLKELKSSFLNFKFSLASLVINFVWAPLFAYLLGRIFLSDNDAIWIGFLMLMVTPCTDWYLVFTGVAKGNVTLSTSILPMNLILQVVLLPIYLMLFFNKSGNIDLGVLLESILLILVVPFTLAYITNQLIKYRQNSKLRKTANFFQQSQIIFLALAVVAMFASEGQALKNNPGIIYILLVPVLIYFTATFLLGKTVAKILKFNYEDTVSLHMTTLARNSPIALAIAVTAFSYEPLIALALVIQPLIELPVLVATSQILLRTRKKNG